MGWKFYDPKSAPAVFSIVWCKWPYRGAKLEPSDEARPVLILDVRERVYDPTNEVFADVTVAYGTGAENLPNLDWKKDLLIGAGDFRALGLHKPTVFELDLSHRKRLPWGDKYFVPNQYIVNQSLIIGNLSDRQKENVLGCFRALNLSFPLP